MKLLYYTWNENSQRDMAESLVRLGYNVICCNMPFSNYEEDREFCFVLEKLFEEQECDGFISFDFFPLIAKCAEQLQKVYISWVYDTPHLTLFSPSVQSQYVKLFIFDKNQYKEMLNRKQTGLYHMPLAVNIERLVGQLGNLEEKIQYNNEISFVGSLYENNPYRQIQYLPDYLRGYMEGIILAQQKVYGYNFVQEIMDEKISLELEKYVKMNLDDSYQVPVSKLYANMLNAEVTARDRETLLEIAADEGQVTLYSGSQYAGTRIMQQGIVDYENGMPKVFRSSKINLNITLRSITSGIPLRALDIMGAGGFLMSNYQPELAEYFIDGQDIVLFDSPEDMRWKINYYLQHDEERQQIAQNGFEKVKKEFSYDIQLKKMLQLALDDGGQMV